MSAAETTEVQRVNLTINGREVQAQAGQTILQAAKAAGIDIPTLCHDPRLEPYGACRMCLVEVEGARGPMAACGTAVREGMKVETHSEKVVKIRKFVLELLLTNHPLDCPVCEAAGDCRLQDYAYEYLVDMVPWGWRGPLAGEPGDHPNIAHFSGRCILCGRCVRICREVMAIGCWGYLNRGYESEVDTPYHLPLQEVGCVSCGQCVSTCPVGAIVGQRTPHGAREWQTTKTVTTCSYCGDGCRLLLHSYRGSIVRVASQLETGLNQGNLCVKGRFGMGYAESPDRLTRPLIRTASGELEEASWEEAVDRIKERLVSVRAEKGEKALAAICGTHCTNEAAYLLQKLMRGVLCSNNIDAVDHPEQAATEKVLTAALGLPAATNSRKDLAAADVILVVGANLTESHPVFALEIIKALRNGKTVIVIDPRRTELASKATYHLAVRPGTDLAVLRVMMRRILDAGLENAAFISAHTEGFASLQKVLAEVDVEAEAALCGVEADTLEQAAIAYGKAQAAAIIYGDGVIRGATGASTVAALTDLALLTGNLGRPGTGLYPLRGGANSQGVADMGARPDLPSLEDVSPGLAVEEMIGAVETGDLSALYVVGADPALALADESRVRAALKQVDFLVVQDSFLTDTAMYADVVLPAAVAGEDEGTFTNTERFIQRVRPAVAPRGESLPDWSIVQTLANALGANWSYCQPAEIMREISQVVPAYQGVSYERIDEEGMQWPLVDAESPGETVLYSDGFATGKARFQPLETVTESMATKGGAAAEEEVFTLITGSVREHHGTGVRTRRSPGITKLVAEARLHINPADAGRLSVAEGEKVRVVGPDGLFVEAPVKVTAQVPPSMLFLPGFDPAAPVTRLVGRNGDWSPTVQVERVV